jgi:predicted ATPase
MTDAAFHLGKVHQLYLIINRMVRISLQDGLGDVSGVVFALYGMSLHPSDGDRRESFRFGQLALKLQEQVGAKQWLCRVMVYVYVLLNHWQAPLQNSCDPLLTAYR